MFSSWRSVRRFLALVCIATPWPVTAAAQIAGPTSDDASLVQAEDALRHAQWQDAERLARASIASHEHSAEGHYLLALALFRENHPRESLNEYTQAAQLRKPTAIELRWVALDYVLLADDADADKWMSESVRWDPGDGEAWYGLGRIKYEENRFGEALADFKKALDLLPESVKAENNLGLTYEALNRPDDAAMAYRQAIAWQNASAGSGGAKRSEQPLFNLGALLLERYRLDEALPLLQEAVALAPKDSKIHGALGQLYERKGQLAQAQDEFEQATAINPGSAALHFQLGQVYRKQGIKARAAEEFARAAQIDGTHSTDGH